jgi:hypothetical protein
MPLYDSPYAVLQRSLRQFRLQLGEREDNIYTARLKPCTVGAAVPMAAPPCRGRPRREPPAATSLPKRVRFNLAPMPPPAAADPETVFPGKPARFFGTPRGSIFKPLPASQPRAAHLASGPHLFFAAS